MGKSDEVRRLLDKLNTELCNAGCVIECETREERQRLIDAVKDKYAKDIAATVGNRTDLSKRLSEVNGLHEFAELFGFSWADDSDWTWHDVACAMADEIDAATGNRSCAFCPEMGNPDSYISHLQSALKWHRPTNPRNTCVVLEGEKPPEEVMFVAEGGGVTHYLPEDTCRNNGFKDDGEWYFVCSRCGCEFEYTDFACEFAEGHGLGSPKFCPNCRARVKEEAE